MEFNFKLIEEHIRKKYKILLSNNKNKKVFINQMLIYSPKIEIEKNQLYICEKEVIPYNSQNKNYIIISIGLPKNNHLMDNLIAIEENINHQELYNYILSLFTYCIKIKEELYTSLLKEEALEPLLKRVSNIIGNPIYLMDANIKMIAMADDGTNAKIYSGSNWLRQGTLAEDFREKLEASHDYNKLFNIHNKGYWVANKDSYIKYNYIFYNFFINNFFSGRMVIYESNKPLSNLDKYLLNILFELTQITIKKMDLMDATKKSDIEILLDRLCDGVKLPQNKLENILKKINWELNDTYYCFCLQLRPSDFIYKTILPVINTIERNISNCIVFKKQCNLCGVIKLNNPKDKKNSIATIENILQQYAYHIGISLSFSGIIKLKTYWDMANIALKMQQFDKDNHLHRFEKLIINYLILKTCDDFDFSILCPEGLKNLIQQDNKHNSELVNTLKVYLSNDRKQKQSAEELFIHRSTFLSRLEKIEEITKCDFEKTDERLLYLILIRYYQQSGEESLIDN